jgi:hypothetical protein
MPPKLFTRAMTRFSDGLEAVRQLADLCETSREATAVRYAETTTAPVAVILSEGRFVQYSVLSKGFRAFRGARRLPRGSPLPTSSPTYALNKAAARVRDCAEETDEVDASDWFSNLTGRLVEEAIGLGSYGKTLTVLSFDHEADDDDEEPSEWDPPRFRR